MNTIDTSCLYDLSGPQVFASSPDCPFDFEAMGLGIWRHEMDTGRIAWSSSLCALLGRAEAPENWAAWLDLLHPDDLHAALAALADWPFDVEYRLRHADGRYLWFHARGKLARRCGDGWPPLAVGTLSDISGRKEAELLLRIQHDFAQLLAGNLNRETLLQAIFDTALALPELTGGGLYWRQADGSYALIAHHGLSAEFIQAVEHVAADSEQAAIIRQGRMQWSCAEACGEDGANPALILSPPVAREGICALVVLPILADGQAIACLNLVGKHYRRLSRRTVAALETLAQQFSQALQRLQAEEDAAHQRENLKGLFETLNDFLFVFDLQGRILHYNPAVATQLGYGADLLGQSILSAHPPDTRGQAQKIIDDILAGHAAACTLPLLRADGGWIRASTRVVRGVWDGKPALFALSRDVTAEYAVQAALQDSENRFRTLFETANDAILLMREGRFIDCNSQALQMYGRSRQDIIGATPAQVSPAKQSGGEDSVIHARRLIAATAAGQPQRFEWRHLRGDGSVFDAEVSLNAVNLGGVTLLQAIVRDITGRKQMEALLRASELRWKFALEGSGQGVWDWDVSTGAVYLSPLWKSMIGYGDDEIANRYEEWESRLHPADKARVLAELNAYLHGGRAEYTTEQRLRCKDGSYRWIQDKGMVVERDASGKPSRMIGVHIDIQDRKQAEHDLRDSESLLRATLDATADGILVAGEDGRTWIANRRFQALWRIPDALLERGEDAEMLAFVTGQLVDPEKFMETVRRLYASDVVTFDTLNFNDGRVLERYTVPLQIGEARIRVWSFRDVSERESAYAALEKERQLLDTLVQTIPYCVWLKDENGVYITCNPQTAKLYGSTLENIIGKTDQDFFSADLAAAFRASDLAVIAQGTMCRFEEVVISPVDGCRRLFETIKTPMSSPDGGLIGVLGIAHDITTLRKQEAALRRVDEQRRRLMHQSRDGIMIFDSEYRVTEASERQAQMLGYRVEALVGMQPWQWDVYADEAVVRKMMPSATETNLMFETRHRRKDGTVYDAEVSVTRAFIDGEMSAISVTRDITERKQAEQALRDSQDMLHRAQAVAHVGSWRVSALGEYEVSDEFRRIAGFAESEPVTAQAWFMRIHHEDRPAVEQAWQDAQSGAPFDRTYRLLVGNGFGRLRN
ncbi:MAG: PAS domain S-box protein [Candidatus Methylumidiphilus sp.]